MILLKSQFIGKVTRNYTDIDIALEKLGARLGCTYKPGYYQFFLLFAGLTCVTYLFYSTFIFYL